MAKQSWRKKTGRTEGGSKEMKFSTATATNNTKQYASFTSVKDHIVEMVQKKFKNGSLVARSIKDDKKYDMDSIKPSRKLSVLPDRDEKRIEQDGFDIEYTQSIRRHGDKCDEFEENLKKAYTVIRSDFCTTTMQQRIEEHPQFASLIEDNPLELLNAIRNYQHDPVRAQYPLVAITDSLIRWLTDKQQWDETLVEYSKRSKQMADVVKGQIGSKFLHNYVKGTKEFKELTSDEDKKTMTSESFEKLCAYVLLKNADSDKYDTLMKGFVNQFSLNNDQYPKMVTSAIDALSNH
jgi:hypothetical protein